MAKTTYSIPASLNRSWLDMELSIGKLIPLKVILFFICSFFGLAWVVTNTFVASAGIGYIIGVVVWWVIVSLYFGRYSATRELRISQIAALFSYLPRKARKVVTRSDASPGNFYSIVGIHDVDDSGLITWVNGDVGQAYLVVGSASRLLFDEDRDHILERNDGFWRKTEPGVEYIFVTTKEPQRVDAQIAHLARLNEGLTVYDPDLKGLLDERYNILHDHVGGNFSSIHQYLIIRTSTLEKLRQAHGLVANESSSSNLMFKQSVMLTKDQTVSLFNTVYDFND